MGMAAEPQFHVLAVDDSLLDRKLIERLLKSSSYQVTTVDSGSKALEFLGWQKESPPSISPDSHHVSISPQKKEVEVNLIITDYCMPGMTGYDLLKKVKESSSLKNIPVVIMSSENVPSRITRCLEEGAEEFFLKPVRKSDVNKLKPHMLRAKFGHQQEDLDIIIEDCQTPNKKQENELSDQPPPPPPPPLPPPQIEEQQPKQPEQPPLNQQPNNSKRKSMEDGLSPDRTRPRYNGLTTVV